MKKYNIKVGDRFGKWMVIKKAPSDRKRICWWCACDCGTIQTVEQYRLGNGEAVRCKYCANEAKRRYKPGDIVGHRTVLYYTGRNHMQAQVAVECKCGRIDIVGVGNLITGNALQCVECAADSKRGQRLKRKCKWCGRTDKQVSFPKSCSQRCRTCDRRATRQGRHLCGKPRAYMPIRHQIVKEHNCILCEPWPIHDSIIHGVLARAAAAISKRSIGAVLRSENGS